MEILGQDPAPATKNMWYENKYRVTMVVRDLVLSTSLWLLYLLLVEFGRNGRAVGQSIWRNLKNKVNET